MEGSSGEAEVISEERVWPVGSARNRRAAGRSIHQQPGHRGRLGRLADSRAVALPTHQEQRYEGSRRGLKLSARLSRLVLFCDLILLQFSVRHFVGPGSQDLLREFYSVDAQRHASAKTLVDLNELLRRSQRRQAAGEIF